MARRYARGEVVQRLRDQISKNRPLVMTGAGSGICAKFIEQGGVDLLGIYNTGYFRMQGYGSLAGMLPITDANQIVFDTAAREVLPQVKQTPVIVGINGVDPLRDMRIFLEDLRRIGISGVHNFPTVGWFDGRFRDTLEQTGLGFEHEIDMLRIAQELDLATVGYAFDGADAERIMRDASPDIFIFHAGITAGGTTGFEAGPSREETASRSQEHFEIARRIDPKVILLAHGAAIVDPEDAQYMLEHTICDGVQLGSSIERMAIEQPLIERARAFKNIPGRSSANRGET